MRGVEDVVISSDPPIMARMLQVEDHTTHKFAFLSVHIGKKTDTCIEAVAWTFGLTPKEYKLTMES